MKKAVLTLLTGVFVIHFSSVAAAFSDVNTGMKYFSAIDFLERKGVIEGYSDGTFGFGDLVNRAEFLALVFKAAGTGTENFQGCFEDVVGTWYENYACTAEKHGWINGYSDGSFKGENTVNFAEALKIAFEVLEVNYEQTVLWYVGLVNKANELGINISGNLGPAHLVKREEAAAIIAGIFDRSLLETDFDSLFEGEVFGGNYILDVPFTSQAPTKNWIPPYDEACEEAVIIMAVSYIEGNPLSPAVADKQILELTSFVAKQGYQVDVSVGEMMEITENFYDISSEVFYGDIVKIENIKKLVDNGYPVILPVAGRLLKNPHYTGSGPPYHTILVIGYDDNGFITHDPGTQFGEKYHYGYSVIDNAIHDFTGNRSTILQGQRAMMVLGV